jgi:hypothetical protein
MLRKLTWEILQLQKALDPDRENFPGVREAAFLAFNCAVTAWHLSDWTWHSCDTYQREILARKFGLSFSSDDQRNLARLKDAIAKECRPLHICREIANGSKHIKLRKADPQVGVSVGWAEVTEATAMRRQGGIFTLVLKDGAETRPGVGTFVAATRFWGNLLGDLFFIEGQRHALDRPLSRDEHKSL